MHNKYKCPKVEQDISYEEYKNLKDFNGTHGVNAPDDNMEPLQWFDKFFLLDKICKLVAQETNCYAQQKLEKIGELSSFLIYKRWKEMPSNDIKAFIALEIGMGLVHKPMLKSYFKQVLSCTKFKDS